MWLTVLGGRGGIPAEGVPCSGYLIEHEGFHLLVDPGYGTATAMLRHCPSANLDAVYVSHGHPDHCADLNPLLRMRVHGDAPAPRLPIYSPPGAVDKVLSLEPSPMIDDAYELREFTPGQRFTIGPLGVETRALPHFVQNAGARFSAGRRSFTYTGDCGPSDDLVELAGGTHLLVAEATYLDGVPEHHRGHLSDARTAGKVAAKTGAARLMLTHLWPGTNNDDARRVASHECDQQIDVARPRLVVWV